MPEPGHVTQECTDVSKLKKLAEGKTKIIYELNDTEVIIHSKDKISAFNAERVHDVEGKARLSNLTNCLIYEYLNKAGIPTHFKGKVSDTEFRALRCDMIPLEWITRRIATGSFLKRNPGVPEGYRFCPPKVEITYKDDEQGDPLWTEEMTLSAGLTVAGVRIDRAALTKMSLLTCAIFEILERAWSTQGCSLIDMKIEFGIHPPTGELILADVIDSDSWRLWPAGDRRLQLDKQFYRDLNIVTPEDLAQLKRNYESAVGMLRKFESGPVGRIVVFMGSESDVPFCEKIANGTSKYGIPVMMHVSSAHKGTIETLRLAKQYEGDGIPTVFICVAGRSNGLGPVLAGNTACPVINCPPIGPDWGAEDIWSSLRLPSGLGCTTVLDPGAAAQAAASILATHDHQVFARLTAGRAMTSASLIDADARLNEKVAQIGKNGC